MTYDVAAVRAQFPALRSGTAHFDGPGGTQVPESVARAVADTLTSSIANRGRVTAAERLADDVVLGARRVDKLEHVAASVRTNGRRVLAVPTDVADPACLTTALDRAAERFGGIEALQYSAPYAQVDDTGMTAILDVTVENLRPQLETSCYAAITATGAVLPAMIAAGTGTLLFTTGASAVTPTPWAGSAGRAKVAG